MEYLEELYAMVRLKWLMRQLKQSPPGEDDDFRFCYDVLQFVSRSFSLVIMQLDEELRDAVCIFYLVLRALDTVEDDMSLSVDFKLRELPKFHTHLHDTTWCMTGVGAGRERELLERYTHVTGAYARLDKAYQDIISDICKQMADGMCGFLVHKVETKADYDHYCHYVAGLVGHGLTHLFVASGLENAQLADDITKSGHMGLFLQKTNIIRDFYEDICEIPPRIFWPHEIWGQYTDDLHNFTDELHEAKAVECLNAMVADALVHVPHVVEYIASLQDPSVFAFCAIPQVMAMATLALVFNNKDVFHTKVKVARGTTARIFHYSTELRPALQMLRTYTLRLAARVTAEDACHSTIEPLVRDVIRATEAFQPFKEESVARSLMTRYPALGGRLLYNLVDNVVGYLGR
ncbi:squalene synthase [Trypanosoma rangeli]|uniref:Squalene synthase n=1 Tax=Trypanosoma rangeli TaxID=5698 RepID=A0A3R7KLT3_TRYRA|nr:squalene synthase [Trypanosoma rangeli]RNF04121.1 squalene synthase [Trypanosoma rangeli]|eukprot:RNF04121.1 squalene synthase [Trypanosoma rangeli]